MLCRGDEHGPSVRLRPSQPHDQHLGLGLDADGRPEDDSEGVVARSDRVALEHFGHDAAELQPGRENHQRVGSFRVPQRVVVRASRLLPGPHPPETHKLHYDRRSFLGLLRILDPE
eukprot:1848225-Rhodomonas_salina.1